MFRAHPSGPFFFAGADGGMIALSDAGRYGRPGSMFPFLHLEFAYVLIIYMKSGVHRTQPSGGAKNRPTCFSNAHNPVDWSPGVMRRLKRRGWKTGPSFSASAIRLATVPRHGRESFEDEKVAAFLNLHFVSIKVHREERRTWTRFT